MKAQKKIETKEENLNAEKEEISAKYEPFELNNLDYNEAINYDKRNFFQIYLCLLTREHKIIFTFIICYDYNILYIKLAIFNDTRILFIFGDISIINKLFDSFIDNIFFFFKGHFFINKSN